MQLNRQNFVVFKLRGKKVNKILKNNYKYNLILSLKKFFSNG